MQNNANAMRPWRLALLGLGLAGLMAGCGSESGGQAQAAGSDQAAPATPGQVMSVERRDIALDKSYPSLLSSENEVTVVARVSGLLEARQFEPGDRVEKGDSLYTIEPATYQASVRSAEADLKSAKAERERAQRDADRYQRLLNQNSVSRQDYDDALADLQVARATVAQNEAALDSARIDLNYTDVEAPVSGAISLSEINVGNLVDPGTELATITPLDPLEVRFQLPQTDALALRRQRDDKEAPIGATLSRPAEQGNAAQSLDGKLDFLGSRVSESTSTVEARAMFDNPEGSFLPGQFVRISLAGLKRYDVLAVPEIAVTEGLMGPQVFVLDDDNKARARTVELGETAGHWLIINSGLETGERVLASDPGGIQPGTTIEPQPFDGDAASGS
ncbi:efflux RND transporter periplasmic adaptor subunit [Halomonas sp. I5-271120]|uniref:efflux RND transporter periplasmic adaptor subunit n=1 Tax=Halomonas sp. I5-271120 TaxID=3061632 RepID=UPI0027154A82|nr:efflux RND transporter periplasmic adaptor subunit [Halomonas sp. I5-271120]